MALHAAVVLLLTVGGQAVSRLKIYIEPRDVWIGWYRDPRFHYVCPLPCLVFRWSR